MDAQKYDGQSVNQLKTEIDKRNTARAEDERIPADGNRPDLVAALQLDDERSAGVAPPDATVPAQAATDAEGEPKEVVQVLVTLVHADHDGRVRVLKPSTDYTNYVRGYGYHEEIEQ